MARARGSRGAATAQPGDHGFACASPCSPSRQRRRLCVRRLVPGIQRIRRQHPAGDDGVARPARSAASWPERVLPTWRVPPAGSRTHDSSARRSWHSLRWRYSEAPPSLAGLPRMDGSSCPVARPCSPSRAAGTVIGRTVALGPAFACGALFLIGVRSAAAGRLLGVDHRGWSAVDDRRPGSGRSEPGRRDVLGGSAARRTPPRQPHVVAVGRRRGDLRRSGRPVRASGVAGSARAQADDWATELQLAAAWGLSAERQTFARDLHDVVSHAVGFIARDPGAAEVAGPPEWDPGSRCE